MTAQTYETWFDKNEVKYWRRCLRREYKQATRRYLESTGRPLTRGSAELVASRSGVEAPQDFDPPQSKREKLRLDRVRNNRPVIATALGTLLIGKPLQRIVVREVLTLARLRSSAFYEAFPTGLEAVYCYWATQQLTQLERITARGIRDSTNKTSDELLQRWSDLVADFIQQWPYGRLSIVSYLVRELDVHGAALAADYLQAPKRKRDEPLEKLTEFARLAASLHRAGARLIYQLAQVLEEHGSVREDGLALLLWGDKSNAAWNMAVSFWKTVLTELMSVGVFDAERQAGNLRRFSVDAWRAGANAAASSLKS